MRQGGFDPRDSRFLGAPLGVLRRRGQCFSTAPESEVRSAASGGSGRPVAPGQSKPPAEKARSAANQRLREIARIERAQVVQLLA
jgi:hypothetical protein